MAKISVSLGGNIPTALVNLDKLKRQASELAQTLVLPTSLEFAKFEHGGRTYAISTRMTVEVDLLENRVPDRVYRAGSMKVPPRPKRRRP
jgi:hypothetical protein